MLKQKKIQKINKKIYLGEYFLNGFKRKVYLLPDSCSAQHKWPQKNDKEILPRFEIGIGDALRTGCLFEFYENLLHEFFETEATEMMLSFEGTFQTTHSADVRYLFMSHANFSELCSRVADTFTALLPDALREINKRRKLCK